MIRIPRPTRWLIAVAAASLAGLVTIGPAAASGGQSVTVDNSSSTTIKSAQSVTIAATANNTCRPNTLLPSKRTVTLTLTGPNGPNPQTETLDTVKKNCNKDVSLSSSVHAPSRNGSYTATVQNGDDSNTASATLDVLIPPARTQGVGVSTTGTIAKFTWTANSEPDVTSYQIMRSNGSVADTVDAGDACGGGSSCAKSVDFGHSAAGTSETFAVRAVRCGLSCSDNVDGPQSSSVTAHFGGGGGHSPSPTPTPTKSAGGGHGGGGHHGGGHGGGQGGGHHPNRTGDPSATGTPSGTATGSRSAHATHSPGSTATTGSGGRGGSGTSGGSGGSGSGPSQQPGSGSVIPGQAAGDGSSSSGLSALWRGLAAAAVLLLVAVHLRTWVGRAGVMRPAR